jgi:hypothetical protein
MGVNSGDSEGLAAPTLLCRQHGPYYVIVERMWTTWSVLYYCGTNVDNMVRIILLSNVCGQYGPYYIIVECMWTTWSALYYCRTYVDNMVRIVLL